MSREFPDFVDPWKAADGRRTFQGTMPMKRMTRLEPLLAQPAVESGDQAPARGDARFEAIFAYDRQGLVTIRLEVEAELPLICQRSLEPYRESVLRRSELAVIESAAEEELIPDHYDPVLVEHRRMALLDLVEEELLLAVPQVPRSPGSAPVGLSTDGGPVGPPASKKKEPSHKPFADLAGLMKTDVED